MATFMVDLLVTTANVKSDPQIRIRLKEEFKRLGLTVEEVADASGIAKGTLDNIMSGRVESMKDVHLQAIWNVYPSLRFEYVLTGRFVEMTVVRITHPPGIRIEAEEKP